MTHPGTPCMFYDDLLQKKNLMQKLIALRQKAGIHCRSEVRLPLYCAIMSSVVMLAATVCLEDLYRRFTFVQQPEQR